nr:hypothetical protein [Brevundimonas naejangsanensis]
MTEASTIEDVHAAKIAQIAGVIDKVQAVRDQLTAMQTSQIDGVDLWLGGLPEPLLQVERVLAHQVRELSTTFPASASSVAQEPA